MKEEEVKKIVEYFTEKLYSHQYYIGRKEAKEDLGLKTVVNADEGLAKVMTELYEEYSKDMNLGKAWNPDGEIEGHHEVNKDYKLAYIENADISNYFGLTIGFKRGSVNVTQQTPQGPIQVPQEQTMWKVTNQGWK